MPATTLSTAMARAWREVGTQFASMFAYDELETAPYNLGWQTHFLNLCEVFDAYGWPPDPTDEAILERLPALNLSREAVER